MPSLAGHPEHGDKALPSVVLLPGAAWLHDADRGLPGGGGARAERGHAGGERGPWGRALGWLSLWGMRGGVQDVGCAQEWGLASVEGQLSLTRGAVSTDLGAGAISTSGGLSVNSSVNIFVVTISDCLPLTRLPAPKPTPSLEPLCAFQTPTKESHSWDPSQRLVRASQELQMSR